MIRHKKRLEHTFPFVYLNVYRLFEERKKNYMHCAFNLLF